MMETNVSMNISTSLFDFNFTNFSLDLLNSEAFDNWITKMDLFQMWHYTYLYYIILIIGIILLLLNTYVLVLFKRRRILRTKSNMLLLNLALSDELVGLLAIPLLITSEKLIEKSSISTFIKAICVYQISNMVINFTGLLTILGLLAIIMDRFFALWKPLTYRGYLTTRKLVVIIITIWLFSGVFMSLSLLIYWPLFQQKTMSQFSHLIQLSVVMLNISERLHRYKYREITYAILAQGVIACGILLVLKFVIIYKRHKQIKAITNCVAATVTNNRRIRRELKAAIVLSTMLFTILIWLIPTIYAFIWKYNKTMYISMYIGRFLISVTNPIFYTLYKDDFRQAVKKDFRKLKERFCCRKIIRAKRNEPVRRICCKPVKVNDTNYTSNV